MISFIERFIQRTRNPSFKFDQHILNRVFLTFLFERLICWIRGLIFKIYSGKNGRVFIGRGVVIKNPSLLRFGSNLTVGDYCLFQSLRMDGVVLGENVSIGAWTRIISSCNMSDSVGSIQLGDNVGIGEYSYLNGAGGLTIGNDTIIGQYFSAHPENHRFDEPALIRKQGVDRRGILIGKNCWIGAKVTILDGVVLGDGCVVGAGAVVNKSFGEGLVIGGVPAKIIRRRGCISG
ncbi:transferase family hexapeptide repeat protein [Alteromonadaceae bacterium 2753L.S.0a.02]|nr:transferase family hexapeptide repeat protein [Alteromonadaceae bacterium 2753L.S.0a.02]